MTNMLKTLQKICLCGKNYTSRPEFAASVARVSLDPPFDKSSCPQVRRQESKELEELGERMHVTFYHHAPCLPRDVRFEVDRGGHTDPGKGNVSDLLHTSDCLYVGVLTSDENSSEENREPMEF